MYLSSISSSIYFTVSRLMKLSGRKIRCLCVYVTVLCIYIIYNIRECVSVFRIQCEVATRNGMRRQKRTNTNIMVM